MSYLNPIRMYVFISAFFFLFFFSIVNPHLKVNEDSATKRTAQSLRTAIKDRIADMKSDLADSTNDKADSLSSEKEIILLTADLERLKEDTVNIENLHFLNNNNNNITIGSTAYSTKNQYDSVQNALPAAQKDGWLKRKINYKGFEIKDEYKKDKKSVKEKLIEKFLHSFPQMLFISLPLFALLLKLVYTRRRNYFYVDHVIYTVHLYCATFLQLFISIILDQLEKINHFGWIKYLGYGFVFYILWYFYKSLRNFYLQSRIKTVLKAVLLYFLAFIVMIILFVVFALITLLNF